MEASIDCIAQETDNLSLVKRSEHDRIFGVGSESDAIRPGYFGRKVSFSVESGLPATGIRVNLKSKKEEAAPMRVFLASL